MTNGTTGRDLTEIDDDFNQAILLLTETELQEQLFLFAHLLRLNGVNASGMSNRAAADYVLGFLRAGKRGDDHGRTHTQD